MYDIFKKNREKTKYFLLFTLFTISFLLLTVVYKNDEKIVKSSELIGVSHENTDLKTFRKFLLDQIKSPFTNLNYEIKKMAISLTNLR